MAIEHTLIEPFVGDKGDFAAFEREFLRIESDGSLIVPDTAIIVCVPVGILDGQKPAKRQVIVESIHSWIENNCRQLREGMHPYQCDVPGCPPLRSQFVNTHTVIRNLAREACWSDRNKFLMISKK